MSAHIILESMLIYRPRTIDSCCVSVIFVFGKFKKKLRSFLIGLNLNAVVSRSRYPYINTIYDVQNDHTGRCRSSLS